MGAHVLDLLGQGASAEFARQTLRLVNAQVGGPIFECGPGGQYLNVARGSQLYKLLRALSKGGILDAVRPALVADSDIRSAK